MDSIELMKVCDVSGIKTSQDCVAKMMEFIEFHTKNRIAVALVEVNRRFGRKCNDTGTKVIDCVGLLVAEDRVRVEKKKGKRWLYSEAWIKEEVEVTEQAARANGMAFEPWSFKVNLIEELMKNGIKELG